VRLSQIGQVESSNSLSGTLFPQRLQAIRNSSLSGMKIYKNIIVSNTPKIKSNRLGELRAVVSNIEIGLIRRATIIGKTLAIKKSLSRIVANELAALLLALINIETMVPP